MRMKTSSTSILLSMRNAAPADHLGQAFLADGTPTKLPSPPWIFVVPDLQEGNIVAVDPPDDMVTVFRAHDVSREALAALLLFH